MSGEVAQLKDEGTRTQVVISGAVAGLVSRFTIAPLDVLKIRLQLQYHSLSDPLNRPLRISTWTTLRQILANEGVTAFWKGNIPAELMYICYGAIQFSTYRSLSHWLSSLPKPYTPPDAAVSFVAGALAGTTATTATYPLDLLRTRFAAQGTERVYASLKTSILDIKRTEGYRGFFLGLGAGISQIVPYMGLFFAAYETLKSPMASLSLPLGSSDAAAGILASVFAKTAVFPLDTVRKRLQVQGPTRRRYVHANIPEYKGVLGTVGQIVRREGWRGLYRGLPVSLLKAAPASAVTMWTYERCMAVMLRVDEVIQEQT